MTTRMLKRALRWAMLGGLAAGWLVAAPALSRAAELVMFESPTCDWCAAWEREVGVVYDKTEEGQRAPLRRVSLAEERPADLEGVSGVVYTPTFVLMENGAERGRILGYPGEANFWGLLGELISRLGGAPAEGQTKG